MRIIKKYLPKSLYRRTLLILIVPVILAQTLTVYLFYERHWSNVSRHLASSLAGEVAMIVSYSEDNDDAAMNKFLAKANNLFSLGVNYGDKAAADLYLKDFKIADLPEYKKQLSEQIKEKIEVYTNADDSRIMTRVDLLNGNVLIVEASDKRLFNSTTYIFVLWMIGLTLILTLITLIFLRNQIRPIIRLARLADNFGRGQDLPAGFKPEGAKEIRQAANAFLLMRERISRHLRQRTEMLAGISHDLRTPLTRMKLEITMMRDKGDSEALAGISEDIDEMESMVNSYLEFVRGDEGEEMTEIDLGQLLQNIAAKYKAVKFEPPAKTIKARVKTFQISRVMSNLIENALKYGNKAEISLVKWQDAILLIVDDNGPGIPAAMREDVFRPFYRMEQSRNKSTGGIGLGLSIVRDIAHAHGGTVELGESELGGLRAVVKLPA